MSQDVVVTQTQKVTSKDGTEIAFEVTGSGPALVLVDGAFCYREFGGSREIAKVLSDRYSVYIYDRRGRGESGNTLPYAVEREIEDLAAVIEAAGGNAFVMGQSSGAGLALEAAAAGVPMRKLAVYEAPYVGVRLQKGRTPDYLADLEAMLAAGNNKGVVDYFMVKMVGGPAFLPIMFRLMPKNFKKLQDIAFTVPYDTRIMNGFVANPEMLGRVVVPTLVMGGSKGAPEMKAAVDAVAAGVPGSTRVILDKQTHNVSPAALAPELIAFFK
jgi:pimeloyl-ACP methyl ester carboxylesterase